MDLSPRAGTERSVWGGEEDGRVRCTCFHVCNHGAKGAGRPCVDVRARWKLLQGAEKQWFGQKVETVEKR